MTRTSTATVTASPASEAARSRVVRPGVRDAAGAGAGFAVLFVLALVAGAGITVYKVSLARMMAGRSGMSPGEATAMTLLSDEGLDATYLASNLRGPGTTPAPTAAPAGRSAEERLHQLATLRDQGLISQAECDARRKVVIDSL